MARLPFPVVRELAEAVRAASVVTEKEAGNSVAGS